MHFLQTFVMQDSWKDSEMINTRYCAAAYFMQPLYICLLYTSDAADE